MMEFKKEKESTQVDKLSTIQEDAAIQVGRGIRLYPRSQGALTYDVFCLLS